MRPKVGFNINYAEGVCYPADIAGSGRSGFRLIPAILEVVAGCIYHSRSSDGKYAQFCDNKKKKKRKRQNYAKQSMASD